MLWRLVTLPFRLMLALSKRALLVLLLLAVVLLFLAVTSQGVFATLSATVDGFSPGFSIKARQAAMLAAEQSRADSETKRADTAAAVSADLKERNAGLVQNNDALNATNTALKQQADTLNQANVALTAENKALQAAAAKAQVTYQGRTIPAAEAVAEAARRIADRVAAAALRRVATAPGEAMPFYGVPVTAAAAAQDLEDDCASLRDLHGLDVAFNPATALTDNGTCQLAAPTGEALWRAVGQDAAATWEGLGPHFQNLPVLLLPPWWDGTMAEGAQLITPMPQVTAKP